MVTTRGLAVGVFLAGVVAAAETRGSRGFFSGRPAGVAESTDSLRLRGVAAGVAESTDSLRFGAMIKDVERIWEEVGRMKKRKRVVIGAVAIEIFIQITRQKSFLRPPPLSLNFYNFTTAFWIL